MEVTDLVALRRFEDLLREMVATQRVQSARFDALETRFSSAERRWAEAENRQERLLEVVARLDERFDAIAAIATDARNGVQKLAARMEGVEAKVDRLVARMDGVEAKVDRLAARMDGVEAKVDAISTSILELTKSLNSRH